MITVTKVDSKRKSNKRKWISLFILFPFFLTLVLTVICYVLKSRFSLEIALINKCIVALFIYHFLSVVILFATVLFDGGFARHRNFLLAIKYHRLKNKIDLAFLNSNIYNHLKDISDNEKIAETPKVEIISETEIHIENLVGQTDKLEKFKKTLSALLDGGLVCETFELDMTQRFYIATMIDLSSENQRVIKNHDDFLDYIEDTSAYQLRIMPNFVKDVSEAPHLLIAGETGSGKSYFLFFIIFQLIMKKVDICIVDRKKGMTKFKTIIGNENSASEIDSIIELIDKVYREMKRRETILEEEYPELIDVDFTDVGFNPFFLIIDELGSLIAELDSKQKKRVNELLRTISQRGRATGVNIIIAMQHPSSDNLPTSIRGQLTFKTILGNTDDTTRHLIFRADDMSDIAFEVGQGFFTNSGTHNKLSILFVPTFEFKLDIENLKQLIELNSSRNEHKKNEST